MFVEAFHRVFKWNYLGGNNCVDVCLVNLLKFAGDQCFGRIIQLTKERQIIERRLFKNGIGVASVYL